MKKIFSFTSALILIAMLVSCATADLPLQEVQNTIISDYTIVYQSGSKSFMQQAILDAVVGLTTEIDGVEKRIIAKTDRSPVTGKEIIIGETNREYVSGSSVELGPLDYSYEVLKDGNIVISGGSVTAVAAGASAFASYINNGLLKNLKPSVYVFSFWDVNEHDSLSDRSSEAFMSVVTQWKKENTSPEWGGFDRDIKESIYALSRNYKKDSEGRIATFAHRGDMFNYPENSLAGVISAILSGADSLEVDFRITKDYVPVLFHDNNLQRMTDYNDKNGKNGLPTSVFIKDWTYEQLRELNLVDRDGNVTEYKIPTVYDVMTLAAGVIQLSFDDKDGIGLSLENGLQEYAEATGSWDSMFWTVRRKAGSLDLMEGHVEEDLLGFAKSCLKDGSFVAVYAFYNDADVFPTWNNDYITGNENNDFWEYAVNKGKRFIGTNRIYDLSVYIRESGMKTWKY